MNLMGANELFKKALLLLDRNDLVRGEQILREVSNSTEPNREMLYYEACGCLGELLVMTGRRDEAVPLLKQVAALETENLFDDLLDYQMQRARRLLAP